MKLPALPPSPDALPLWPPLLAARGPGARSEGHAHHAMHLVLACTGTLRVRADAGTPIAPARARARPGGAPSGAWRESAGVLTAPDAPHAIDARGTEVVLVFLDPESEAGAALRAVLAGEPVRLVDAAARDALADIAPTTWMQSEGRVWMRRAVAALGGDAALARAAPPRVHPRVRRLLAHLKTLGPRDDASLAALAAHAGLSPSRLMHAFTESVGVPLRPYLAWLKLQRAAAAVVSGMPLAEAAHAAGFADAAHMTRTFRRAFGMTPSSLRPATVTASAVRAATS